MAMHWKLYEGGKTPPPNAVVKPDERLSWPRTVGLGAQHVVAMFGATFVFPLIMGLSPQLAVLMSGVATMLFLLIVRGKIPSYLGTSAAFVAAVAAIRAQGGNSASVTGAILVSGIMFAAVGVAVHYLGGQWVARILPPPVTGAVVMLIGFSLAPVACAIYWPQDQWVALATMAFVILATVILPGFWSRIAVFLALIFGIVLSWLLDTIGGPITSFAASTGTITTHSRFSLDGVADAAWFGFPPQATFGPDGADLTSGWHMPSFSAAFILLVIPSVIALIAENAGHVKAVAVMTDTDLDPYLGRAFIGDGIGTVLASAVGGSPTTTYAENIGVMAATRIYSTAAYWVAAVIAVLFGLCPKFGALVSATPGGVLGGITVVLYGMIGLLGAKIWHDAGVDFADPINLAPLAAGVIIGIGGASLVFSPTFNIAGIALGTIVAIVFYHVLRIWSLKHPVDAVESAEVSHV